MSRDLQNDASSAILSEIWLSLGGSSDQLKRASILGNESLPSVFPVSDLAAASIASAGLAISELLELANDSTASVIANKRLASLWFGRSINPQGWKLPPTWDSVAGNYPCLDGWIRLHTNAPHHRKAALQALLIEDSAKAPATRDKVAEVLLGIGKQELEDSIVDNGGCAAAFNTAREWASHPQGSAVSTEPLVHFNKYEETAPNNWKADKEKPLKGIRVLDLTRILAGPVATRLLAGLGSDVLRIDPIGWDEPAAAPDVTLGKRCARLNLKTSNDREVFKRLLSSTDILIHGFRAGAMCDLGFDSTQLREIKTNLIEVTLNAYGWTGPWKQRRGFDSLVQMSCGIAHEGMRLLGKDSPYPLPVQALDHSAGYTMAAAAIRGLSERVQSGSGSTSKVSLARMAKLLMQHQSGTGTEIFGPADSKDFQTDIEQTVWGPAMRLLSPLSVSGTTISWDFPAGPLGSAEAKWI